MHPQDVMVCGIGLAVLGAIGAVIAVVTVLKRRKRAERLAIFRRACTELGLKHREDGWYGERFGTQVSVFWGLISVGHGKQRSQFWFTVYTARFEPLLTTGAVMYTGVERYVRKAGFGDEVHVAAVEYWNDLPLPGGGTLWDVWKRPDQTSLKHVEIAHEALREKVCVYARDEAKARTRLDGELAEAILLVARSCNKIWLDDSRLILLVHGDERTRLIGSDLVDVNAPHAEPAPIEEWLKKTATFANEIRRVSA